MKDVSMPQTFLSNNRHSSTTEEDLSERWELSISQVALTLKATTHKLTRSEIITLARRYRADQMFDVLRTHGTMSTDTMDARWHSIHYKNYCQVCRNKELFVESYPIKNKYDCHLVLDKFVKEYWAPEKTTYDGKQEQIRRRTEFQRVMRKYEIKWHVTEKKQSNQNAVEVRIQELQQRWYSTMFRTYFPRALWSYGIPYVSKIMQIRASFSADLQGRTPLEALTDETPDISE